MDDPYAVLGVSRDASGEELAAAWRRLAKEWHPDLRGDASALARMVQLNAAYEQALAERSGRARAGERGRGPSSEGPRASRRRGAGWWLPAHLRRVLGPELLRALTDRERVQEVAACHASGSSALLVITERRLLWLLDDLVLGRVRSLPLAAVRGVDRPPSRPWRRRGALRVRGGASAVTFAGLTPAALDAVIRAIGAAANGAGCSSGAVPHGWGRGGGGVGRRGR